MSDLDNKEGGSSLGLPENVASLLCYLAGFITGIIFLVLEKKSEKVRYHAIMSIGICVVLVLLNIAIGIVNAILFAVGAWAVITILSLVVSLITLAIWITLMVLAYLDKPLRIPVLSDLAEKNAKFPPAAG